MSKKFYATSTMSQPGGKGYYEITANENFLRILEKISLFVAFDMKETEFQDVTA